MSTIIFLMGVGSVGKTSIAKELQTKLGDDYLVVGFDYAVSNLDKKYWPGGGHEKEGFYFHEHKTESGVVPELMHGKIGEEFLEKMITEIIDLAKNGKNLIMDQVLSDEELTRLSKELPGCHFLNIGLKPPLEEVIKRERERGDRKVGMAKSMYENFYQNKRFDIEINTKEISSKNAAELISDLLPKPRASNKIG